MRIFLVRHGQSEGNMDLDQYRVKGDPHIELTDEGWRQAIRAGQFLGDYLRKNPSTAKRPIRLWSSTHMRTRQTSVGLIEGTQGALSLKEARVNDILVEQDFGLFNQFPNEADRQNAIKMITDFYNAVEARDKFYARTPMGESPHDTVNRVRPFIGTLMRDRDKGTEDVVLVTHGVTLRAFCMAFLNIDSHNYANFKNPENASVYVIEGDGPGGYTLKQIFNGEAGQAVDIDWGKTLRAYENKFPSVPEKYRLTPPAPPAP